VQAVYPSRMDAQPHGLPADAYQASARLLPAVTKN
jgi:hypothetical protein